MTGAPPPSPGTTVATVTRRWEQFASQTITASGEVDTVSGRRAFTIGDGDFVADAGLLILSAVPLPVVPGRMPGNALLMDDQVLVTYGAGPVPDRSLGTGQFVLVSRLFRPFDHVAYAQELGGHSQVGPWSHSMASPPAVGPRFAPYPESRQRGEKFAHLRY